MKFVYKLLDYGIIIQTDSYCHLFDNPKNAASAAYELLQGVNTTDWDNNEPDQRVEEHSGDQDYLRDIIKNYDNRKGEFVAYRSMTFFEEVMLFHLLDYPTGGSNE